MKISTRTEYGMRVLVQLARHHGEGPLSLACIARDEKLPHAYLEQLVSQLRRAGLVTATRGHSGGYQLARPPVEISLADAVRVLDGPLLEMPCAGVENLEVCDRPMPCSVHELFMGVYEAMNRTLGGTTLADAAASAGGPPYPAAVRRRRLAQHAALATRSAAVGEASRSMAAK